MIIDHFQFTLPGWIIPMIRSLPETMPGQEERMRLAIDLAAENIRRGTGGPFGAAVFEQQTGRLISAGVNLVITQGSAMLHAEIIALMLAHKTVGTFQLNHPDLPDFELVTSVEPCAMCLGAVPWSGVRQVICGARHEDAETAGFDEGAKPDDWIRTLEQRGIRVIRDLLRPQAAAVLQAYKDQGGVIYNGSGKDR